MGYGQSYPVTQFPCEGHGGNDSANPSVRLGGVSESVPGGGTQGDIMMPLCLCFCRPPGKRLPTPPEAGDSKTDPALQDRLSPTMAHGLMMGRDDGPVSASWTGVTHGGGGWACTCPQGWSPSPPHSAGVPQPEHRSGQGLSSHTHRRGSRGAAPSGPPEASSFGSFLLSSSLTPCSPASERQTGDAHWAGQGSNPRLGPPAALAPRRRALGRRLALPVTIFKQN